MNKIEPYLDDGKSLIDIEEETGLSKRILRYWIHKYRKLGLKGLIRKTRSDSGRFKITPEGQEAIKHLALSHKRNAVTSIH